MNLMDLFVAAEFGVNIELSLLDGNVDVNTKNKNGLTAMIVAARYGHARVCQT